MDLFKEILDTKTSSSSPRFRMQMADLATAVVKENWDKEHPGCVKVEYILAGVSLLAFEVYASYIKSVARSFYSQLLLLWIPMRTKFPPVLSFCLFLMLFLIPFI